jgi:flagellar assembly factor FliW
MVKFRTARFGELQVDEGKIIHFPHGLLGFAAVKRYILLDYEETPVKWLQAVDDPDVAFIVMDPTVLTQDYSIALDDAMRKALQLEEEDDLAILTIVRVESGKVIANFKGPLLFNSRLKIGLQAILE